MLEWVVDFLGDGLGHAAGLAIGLAIWWACAFVFTGWGEEAGWFCHWYARQLERSVRAGRRFRARLGRRLVRGR